MLLTKNYDWIGGFFFAPNALSFLSTLNFDKDKYFSKEINCKAYLPISF